MQGGSAVRGELVPQGVLMFIAMPRSLIWQPLTRTWS